MSSSPVCESIDLHFRGSDALSKETALSKLFLLPSEKGSTLKRKYFFFPFRVDDSFSEGMLRTGKQTGSHAKCLNRKSRKVSPLYKMMKYLSSLSCPLSCPFKVSKAAGISRQKI